MLLEFAIFLLTPVRASACDLTDSYVKGHAAHYQRDVQKAQGLLNKMAAFETSCKTVENKIAQIGGTTANGRSCEGLNEVKALYDRIDESSVKCSDMALALNKEIDNFYQDTMDPDSQRDRGLYEAISGDPYLSSRCGNALGNSGELYKRARAASEEVNSAVQRTADDRKKFTALAETSRSMKESSGRAFSNCAAMGSIVSPTKLGTGAPNRVPAQAPATKSGGASSITGVEDDAAKRAKTP